MNASPDRADHGHDRTIGHKGLPAGLELYRNGNEYRIIHTGSRLPLHFGARTYWRTQRDLVAAAAHLPKVDWTAEKSVVVAALGTDGEKTVRRLMTPTREQMPTWLAAMVPVSETTSETAAETGPRSKPAPDVWQVTIERETARRDGWETVKTTTAPRPFNESETVLHALADTLARLNRDPWRCVRVTVWSPASTLCGHATITAGVLQSIPA